MKRVLLLIAIFFLCIQPLFAQEDMEGCKDHPLFTRMTDFYLGSCEIKDYDAFAFSVQNSTEENCKKETVEGTYYYYYYHVKDDVTKTTSALQLFRNFENALNKINAIVAKVIETGNSSSFITAKIAKNGMETWVCIYCSDNEYQLYIVEKEAMVQVIQANEMLDALNKDGFIALYINFDTGKSTIKDDSQPIIDQIFNLLNDNQALKVSVEGHTDNTGTVDGNKKLSEDRAKAVADALTKKGINKTRLATKGWGQERPIADNRTDEGKTKNRRVEIVKM